MPTDPHWNLPKKDVDRLWGSLLAIHRIRVKNTSVRAYGDIPFTRDRFERWLVETSIQQTGIKWECPYSRLVITLDDASIDHIIPLARGGTSELANLAVSHKRWNRIKGPLPAGRFFELRDLLVTWAPDEAKSVYDRLAVAPGWARQIQLRERKAREDAKKWKQAAGARA